MLASVVNIERGQTSSVALQSGPPCQNCARSAANAAQSRPPLGSPPPKESHSAATRICGRGRGRGRACGRYEGRMVSLSARGLLLPFIVE